MLEIQNIETFYGLIYALRGVSLSVEEGTVTAILGNNGAGKSTILKTVMGLLEDQPDKGAIEFLGKRIDGKDPEVIVRMGISYVPEGTGGLRRAEREGEPADGRLHPKRSVGHTERTWTGCMAIFPY